jgi:hypothetical protein
MVRRFLTKREKLKVATLVKDLETFNISVDELDNVKKAFKIK